MKKKRKRSEQKPASFQVPKLVAFSFLLFATLKPLLVSHSKGLDSESVYGASGGLKENKKGGFKMREKGRTISIATLRLHPSQRRKMCCKNLPVGLTFSLRKKIFFPLETCESMQKIPSTVPGALWCHKKSGKEEHCGLMTKVECK